MSKEKSPERLKLEAEARLLEIPFGSNWRDETIAEKIAEAKVALESKMEEAEVDGKAVSSPRHAGGTDTEIGFEVCDVRDALRHDGKLYEPGGEVRLTEVDAKALAALAVVSRRN